MDFVKKIEGMQKVKSSEDTFAELVYILMRELHQPYKDIMAMPIPLMRALMKCYEKEMEARKKAMKKKK